MVKIPGGYYIKARKTRYSEIAKAPPHVREIWDYLMGNANHTTKISSGREINRGQLVRTYNQIIEDLTWYVGYRKCSYKKHHCEIAMKWLTKRDMVTTTKTTRGMVISIVNFDFYQNPKNYENDSGNDDETTRERQCNDTINKNEKNEKNEKNPPTPPKGDDKKKPTWKTDFTIYQTECRNTYKGLLADPKWIEQQEELNPGVDIPMTMKKAYVNYWSTEGVWKKKKRSKTKTINWKSTWQNALSQRMNRVYKDAIKKNTNTQQPKPTNFEHSYEDEQS